MLYYVLIGIHIVVCLFLIASILLQAGRGGGLAEGFGGQAQSILGTQAPTMLKRMTEVAAIVFLLMCVGLAMYTARRGTSLFSHRKMPFNVMPGALPKMPAVDAAKALPAGSAVPVKIDAAKMKEAVQKAVQAVEAKTSAAPAAPAAVAAPGAAAPAAQAAAVQPPANAEAKTQTAK
ncbi:MAG: preprotein translocase subunit SecG [Candidatus Omnitrophica bacterium]|nr:preprotein translocase subunit SecG [Candidatus Omnitrophota bacterium]